MANIFKNRISTDMRKTGIYYSILADVSKDYSKREQLAIVLKYESAAILKYESAAIHE